MSADLEALAELGRRMVDQTPQAGALGLRFVSVAPGVAVIEAPYRDDLVGDPATGVMAGGVVTSLLDHVCGLAIKAAALDFNATATLDLRIDYMRPAEPRRGVIGRAHCYKLTRSIAFVRATAFEDDPDDPIATAQGAFVLSGAPAKAAT
ncbi:MAG TPA: PaaI family thioesterase [Caulobacteraceae bacterium]|nr:PaaI family thioesterase [Caulobacteraceae bacterium]